MRRTKWRCRRTTCYITWCLDAHVFLFTMLLRVQQKMVRHLRDNFTRPFLVLHLFLSPQMRRRGGNGSGSDVIVAWRAWDSRSWLSQAALRALSNELTGESVFLNSSGPRLHTHSRLTRGNENNPTLTKTSSLSASAQGLFDPFAHKTWQRLQSRRLPTPAR